MLVLLERLPLELRVDLAGLRVRTEGPAEQQDVRLRAVDGVVLPAPRLLDADAPPLRFAQAALLGEGLGQPLGENGRVVAIASNIMGGFWRTVPACRRGSACPGGPRTGTSLSSGSSRICRLTPHPI